MNARREFLVTFALATLAAPRTFYAWAAGRVYRIGLLSNNRGPHLEAFHRSLRELGYVEGRNLVLEDRSAEGRSERLPNLAAELVRLNVDVLVAPDPPSAAAAKAATKSIPIVIRSSNDPVEAGFVASLARPGGNITGVYSLYAELTPKRLEILKEAIPRLARVAVLWNPDFPGTLPRWDETQIAAKALGLELHSLEVRRSEELEEAFKSALAARAGAVITLRNPIFVTQKHRLIALAARARLPAMYDEREFIDAGGLMAYGANLDELYRRTGAYADKILKGAKPGDLPVEQPTKLELVINLKTARALGLTMPPSLLLRAARVIE
jgi:putative ABC transport system substrate-binding protein